MRIRKEQLKKAQKKESPVSEEDDPISSDCESYDSYEEI
mgnify:FL=1